VNSPEGRFESLPAAELTYWSLITFGSKVRLNHWRHPESRFGSSSQKPLFLRARIGTPCLGPVPLRVLSRLDKYTNTLGGKRR